MKNNFIRKISLIMLSTLLISVPVLSCCSSQGNEVQSQEVPVKRANIEVTVPADGNLSLVRERKLTFGTSGTVTEINVEEGERVKEGDILARLDTESLELTVSTAEISLKAAAIDVEIATNAYRKITYPYTYYTFAFGVPESLAAITDALNRLESVKSEISIGMTPEQLTEVSTSLKKATDSLITAQEKLGRGQGPDLFLSGQLPLTSFWTLREVQLNMDKANLALDRATNDLKKAQDELPKAVIKAPLSGLIAKVNLKEGDRLTPGDYQSRAVFELIDPDTLELQATVDEIDIASVRVGQEALITLDALPDIEPVGTVTFISPLSRTEGGIIIYDVKISVDASKYPGMMSGMTAKTDIVTNRRTNVLIIPERAIYRNAEGNNVVKIKVGDIVEERVIKTGLSDGIETEVTGGLTEGEVVVIERRTAGAS